MTIHEFIFSGKTAHRIFRHGIFWIAYCTFFYVQSIVPSDYHGFFSGRTYLAAFKSVTHFVPVCILFVYVSVYYIFPTFIEKRKVAKSILAILTLFAICTAINFYFSYKFNQTATPNIKAPITFNIVLGLAYLNAAWGFTAAGIALAIKLTKKWIAQQKELYEIRRNNMRTEVELQKSRVLPHFLLNAVDNLKTQVINNSANSAPLIIMLSDILSYTLYESGEEKVEISSELLVLRQYIAIENSADSDKIHLEVDAASSFNGKYIPPMSLLAQIQNCVNSLDALGLKYHLKIRIRSEESLRVRLFCNFNDPALSLSGEAQLKQKLGEWIRGILAGNNGNVDVKQLFQSVVVAITLPVDRKTGIEKAAVRAATTDHFFAYV
jgi:hypothetical protein